jgi:F-type H+-transporting ATPase subunit b
MRRPRAVACVLFYDLGSSMTWFISPAYAEEAAAPAPAVPAAPTETHTEVGHEAGGKTVFPPFDTQKYPSQILWYVIFFGLLYLLMKRVLVPRLSAIVEGRAARIASDLEEAQRLRVESDKALGAYEKALADARSSAHTIAQASTDEAKATAAKQRADVENSLSAKLETAEARIADIKAKALGDVNAIAEETAAAVVAALSGQQPSQDEVAKAVSAVAAK